MQHEQLRMGISFILKPGVKAVATANSLKVEGAGEVLEITRHVEHTH